MSGTIDCLVVGGGVVGLAIGRAMARSGQEVAVLESERQVGAHTSSRNSEVIHAGIYYQHDSLKARLCLTGKRLLYEYCEHRGVPHARLGKLIVASGSSEMEVLRDILRRGRGNGVTDLEWLEASQVRAFEPQVRADVAVLSPSTGIVDSHALMMSYQGDLEDRGGAVVLGQTVTRVVVESSGFAVHCDGEKQIAARSRTLINAAGLWASDFAHRIDGLSPSQIPATTYAKGHYFDYAAPSPFRKLVYPVPIVGGLGVHATNDLAGRTRFGPDAEWVADINYDFDATRKEAFVSQIVRYFPALEAARLSPAYTGLRPKLYQPGEVSADFMITGPSEHGVSGLVNLFGIESPGLTASLAIADYVRSLLRDGGE
ncbi:MAG: NAD(P)/FAD-dependent oxidoreductase [Pseudomonadota bacterium]